MPNPKLLVFLLLAVGALALALVYGPDEEDIHSNGEEEEQVTEDPLMGL